MANACQGEVYQAPASVVDTTAKAAQGPEGPAAPLGPPVWTPGIPEQLFDVVKVVDGDTIHIMRNGKIEKLRFLSVDTEEKITGNSYHSRTKPQTVYGEECTVWAKEFFAALAEGGSPPRVGLLFPDGEEARDIYGRLLCHVILPDGRDFSLILVREGRSPYFNKYGNSRLCHFAFVAAQKHARAARLGIWNPATNQAATEGAPSVRRPYGELLPWWQARADAIDLFRERHAATPETVLDAEDPDALAAAMADEKRASHEVEVFCQVDRLFEEDSGDLTILFRATDRSRALRARIPAALRQAHEPLDLAGRREEFRQNYMYLKGTITPGPRGFEIISRSPDQWRPAGPEPAAAQPLFQEEAPAQAPEKPSAR
jgi:micrococcal nuclease